MRLLYSLLFSFLLISSLDAWVTDKTFTYETSASPFSRIYQNGDCAALLAPITPTVTNEIGNSSNVCISLEAENGIDSSKFVRGSDADSLPYIYYTFDYLTCETWSNDASYVELSYQNHTLNTCNYTCNLRDKPIDQACPIQDGVQLLPDYDSCSCYKPCSFDAGGRNLFEVSIPDCGQKEQSYYDAGYTDVACSCPDSEQNMNLFAFPPICPEGQQLDNKLSPPACAIPAPTCNQPNMILNNDTTACICIENYIPIDSIKTSCAPDLDGDGIPDYPSDTQDSDGDGTPDIQDPDSPFYGLCLGVNKLNSPTFYGKPYALNYYDFKNTVYFEYCGDYVNKGTTGLSYVDGSYDKPDKNPSCILKYCYIHDIDKKYFKTNPCDEEFDRVEPICKDDEIIIGYADCKHNGMQVTNDTIKCVKIGNPLDPNVVKPSDCDSNWYESYNDLTKSCMCDDGYSRTKWGICSKTLDANSTLQQQDDKSKQDKDDALLKNILDSNTSTSNSSLNNDSVLNTLSGIRQDLNGTNSLLSDISSKLSDNSLDSNGSDNIPASEDDGVLPVKDFLDNIKNDITNIVDSFYTTKELLSNPFQMNIASRTCKPFVISAFGRTVELDLYNLIGIIRPALTFIITILIYLLSIKIYIKALGFKNE